MARPLLALDSSKAKTERGWGGYLLSELGLVAIDVVMLRTDMRTAVRQEAVVDEVAGCASLQVPGRPPGEYEEVGRWVVERLINIEQRDRSFRHVVGSMAESIFEAREFPFQILKEVPDEAGQAALIVTDAAINVLVHAIDVDIASEQIAAEAKLEALLKRARITDAARVARNARIQSIRYAKDIRDRMEAMKRNVRAIDWDGQLKETVDTAIAHVAARSEAEAQMQGRVSDLLEVTNDEHKRQQLEELYVLIGDCQQRHSTLVEMLFRVGPEFRLQQDRQVFVAPALHARVHLEDQLLLPVLELPREEALVPLGTFTRAALGPVRPHVMYLPDFFTALAKVTEQQQIEPAAVQTDHEWEQPEGPTRFSAAQHTAVRLLLNCASEQGIRLSELLRQIRIPGAGGTGPGTDELLVLRVQDLFRQVPVAQLAAGEVTVVAIDDGTELDDEVFGGCDFLLLRTQSGPTPEPPPGTEQLTPFPAPRRPADGAAAESMDQENS
ncbi:hypothetical protein ACWC9R_28425 [Streptomyces sp. NPDC001219]